MNVTWSCAHWSYLRSAWHGRTLSSSLPRFATRRVHFAFSIAGILWVRRSAPYIATDGPSKTYGLQYVVSYLTSSAVLTFFGRLLIRETQRQLPYRFT